jgi:hypothetical protein
MAAPAAQASHVDLGTAKPFVVLGGQSVTNTGPSVLNGDLGVSPGTSITGFGLPAVVNGTTHNSNAVALNAQADALTAYDVAAGEPVSPGNVLTGLDLGDLALTPGNYRYATSAQLTGELILDAQGDPNAQFIFQIGSTLTTASNSSVRLIGNASPCNVYWQVGSSATLGSTTAFQGNVLAKETATLDSGATVLGRVLAYNGSVTLINNTLDASMCQPPATTPDGDGPGDAGAVGGGDAPGTTPGTTPIGATPTPGITAGPGGTIRGAQPTGPTARPTSRVTFRRTPRDSCRDGFRASVSGANISRVEFRLDGRRISALTDPRQVEIQATRARTGSPPASCSRTAPAPARCR